MVENFDESIDPNLILHLSSLGDVVPLDFVIDISLVKNQLLTFKNDWKVYNPRKPNNRQGLSITSFDGMLSGVPDLDSLFIYNKLNSTKIRETDIKTETPVAKQVTAIQPILNTFDSLGRSHFIRLNRGGFFPIHRDSKTLNITSFRVITLCHNCEHCKFVFVFEDKVLHLDPGRPYFLNTRKEHAVFSFVDDSVQCVMNIPLTQKNYKCLISKLQFK